LLVLLVAVLSGFAAGAGIFSSGGNGESVHRTIRGGQVTLYGQGVYRDDSVSMAAQAVAQDVVTLVIGIPMLLFALYLARRGLLKGRLLLAGILGYFLYTYASMSFLSMYNSLFLVYVFLMSASFFAFTLTFMSFDSMQLQRAIGGRFPSGIIGGFLIFIGTVIALMWLGRIAAPMREGTVPLGLDHYTTLVIQAMDLGFVVPVALLAGTLVLRKNAFGSLLASIVIVKGAALSISVSAMIVGMLRAGEQVSLVEIIIFPIITAGVILMLVILLGAIKEPRDRGLPIG
jgi:hypothetical protein